jgi:hypothetical protein
MSKVKTMLAERGPDGTFVEARRVARDYALRLRSEGRLSFSDPAPGRYPTVHIVRRTLAEAWEDTVMAVMGVGQEIHTHYDPTRADGAFQSFPSIEATVMVHIEEPFGEPRFHKHYLGGWLGFGDYRAEIEGVKDGWMISPAAVAGHMRNNTFDEIKGDERWNYMYSQRLRAFPFFDHEGKLRVVNQLKQVVDNLRQNPTSRSAQCITWDPRWDHNDEQMGPFKWSQYHSPCLQRFWFRLQRHGESGELALNVNGHWRSRDLLKALPSNIYGVTEGMHEEVRLALEAELGEPVARGSYTDISDSLHLYGHYLDPRLQGLDAESYLEDIFRIAAGEPIASRVIMPGTDMYELMMEDIEREYQFRRQNPDYGRRVR